MKPRALLLVPCLLLPGLAQGATTASHLLLLSPDEAKVALVDDHRAPDFDRLTPIEIAEKMRAWAKANLR
jgi:hypothetical protein